MTSPVEPVTSESARATVSTRLGSLGLAHYLGASFLSRTADEGARVALVLVAVDRLSSAALGGTLVATLLVPHVLTAPLVGAWVDRSPRPGAVLAITIAIFATGLATTVYTVGRSPLWLTYLVLAIAGSCGPAITGGLTSRVPGIVGPMREARAFGWDSLFYNLASMAGPASVALVAACAGPGAAILLLSAMAGLGAVGVATLRISPEPVAVAGADRPRLLGGARAIVRSSPVLRTLTLTTSLGHAGPGALAVVATVLAVSRHQPAAGGLLLSTVAGGALLGSLWCTWRPIPAAHAAAVTAWSMILIGVPLAAAATTESLGLTATLFGLSGLFVGPFASALFLARSQLAPEAVRAQVFTIGAGLKVTAAALGAALIGLASQQTTSAQLLLVAASPILAGVLAVPVLHRHQHPRDRPREQHAKTTS
jgi:hypothetical protein